MTGATLTPEREQEIVQLRGEMWDRLMRETGIDVSLTEPGYERLNEQEKTQVVQVIKVCGEYERRLRESTRDEHGLLDLSRDGVPWVEGAAAPPPPDEDPMTVLAEEGMLGSPLPGFMRVGSQPGRRVMILREGQPSPEDDTDLETVTTPESDDDDGVRQPCRNCPYNGEMADGTKCPKCKGTGFVTVQRAREALAVMRLAESAVEAASAAIDIPLRSDDDLASALATAQELGGTADAFAAKREDGTWDLTVDGVPSPDAETPAEPDEADLIDLGRDVPKAGPVEPRPASEIIAEAQEVGA
jgi:hypothetical protein